MPGLEVVTFGCRLNAYESEVMRAQAEAAGLADAVIFNTCAVTGEAERQARQAIRRMRRSRPEVRIIVTGCAAQIDPARYAAMAEVDQVLGNAEKLLAESYRSDAAERVAVGDIFAPHATASDVAAGIDATIGSRIRAFIQVQQGCDHRCTFCSIPFGRGDSRSVPIGAIVEQVRRRLADGCREIVLSGVDITGFGADLPGHPTLGQMMRRLLALVPELKRLRLSSLDPVEIDDDLWRLIAEEERLLPHLHLSLQSGDDLILKRMKRRHGRQDAIDACRRARALRPGIALGADLIAGFPTESEAMFENSLSLVDACELTHLHVFPYSARPDTPAARMPQVDGGIVHERAARLREAGASRHASFLAAQVGRIASVLAERGGLGYTEHYAQIRLGSGIREDALTEMRVIGVDGAVLTGEIHTAEAA
ncbi:MAG: 2-methylthioadenine synthetase [Rhodospirillales bacterium]|nr:2-methylthioadenine synthetase [Rhodospirillales bacterium]